MKAPIAEIFGSIQGEGPWLGQYCTFVRFAGCNLNCTWCDSKGTWFIHDSQYMEVEDVVKEIEARRATHVVFTGGEPSLYHSFIREVINKIQSPHFYGLETNGVHAASLADCMNLVVVSPKPQVEWKIFLVEYDICKLVMDTRLHDKITSNREWWEDYVRKTISRGQFDYVLLQPCDGVEESMEWIIQEVRCMPELLRAGIQLHKVYGVQ